MKGNEFRVGEEELQVKGNVIGTYDQFRVKRHIMAYINDNLRTFDDRNETETTSGKREM